MIDQKDSKKPSPLTQNWYATEFWLHDGTLRGREYKSIRLGIELREMFGFEKMFGDANDQSVGYHIDTADCEPPKFAEMEVDYGYHYGDYADPQPKLLFYYASEEEAQARVDKRNANEMREATRYYVIGVDANGQPPQSEIDRLRPILLAEKEELDKQLSKKRKDRYRAQKRRDANRAVVA